MPPTRVARHLDASRARVYAALVDTADVARWRFPEGMSCQVHEWDAREGGRLRVSLTYDDPSSTAGKSSARTDTYTGRFERLVPDQLIVEVDEFETDDPHLAGPMTITITLTDAAGGGTDLVAVHEGLPDGVSPTDNELGWRQALDRLAALTETG